MSKKLLVRVNPFKWRGETNVTKFLGGKTKFLDEFSNFKFSWLQSFIYIMFT